jgi:hypothetical protein
MAVVAGVFIVTDVFIVTAMLVMAIVIVITRVRSRNVCNMRMLTMHVRITRASMMEAAPEYRVQQHRCDGDNPARGVHVLNPSVVVICSLSTI